MNIHEQLDTLGDAVAAASTEEEKNLAWNNIRTWANVVFPDGINRKALQAEGLISFDMETMQAVEHQYIALVLFRGKFSS